MMWDGMNARGPAACLYFVVWVFVGYYVLLNLLLAILITNFQVGTWDRQIHIAENHLLPELLTERVKDLPSEKCSSPEMPDWQ